MKKILRVLPLLLAVIFLAPNLAGAEQGGRKPAAESKTKKAKKVKKNKKAKAKKETRKAKKAKKSNLRKNNAHKSHAPGDDLNPAPKGNSADYIPPVREDELPPPNVEQND